MKKNQQTPEKRDHQANSLEVHSIFSTIQGEGPFCGHASIFVRLAGCNLQCPGCDTAYTEGRIRWDNEDIVKLVNSERIKDGSACSLVVITGGEPFRQNLEPLICLLIDAGYKVQVESNGTMPVPKYFLPITEQEEIDACASLADLEALEIRELRNEMFTLVCSPKAAKIHPSVAARADCFKYVMKAGNTLETDGLPLQALDHKANPYLARPPEGYSGKIYLQPMDEQDPEKNLANIQAVLNSCKKHNYILQLQIHKYLGVE